MREERQPSKIRSVLGGLVVFILAGAPILLFAAVDPGVGILLVLALTVWLVARITFWIGRASVRRLKNPGSRTDEQSSAER